MYAKILSLYLPDDIINFVIMPYIIVPQEKYEFIKKCLMYELSYSVYKPDYKISLKYFRMIKKCKKDFPDVNVNWYAHVRNLLF